MTLVNFMNLEQTRLSLDELINQAIEAFMVPGKVVISYSGGKDSSVLTIMACEAIKRGYKKSSEIEIIFADTLMEIEALDDQIKTFVAFMNAKGIKFTVVKRKLEKSYWVNILGKGHFVPSFFTRYCVRHLKMEPILEYAKDLGNYNMAVGIRLDESTVRNEKYSEGKLTTCDTAGECLIEFEGENKIYPILNWKNCDIWDFIQFHDLAYDYPVEKLRELYFQRDTMRYGCWNCTVASDFELLKLHSKLDSRYSKLLKFRYKLNEYTSFKFQPQDWIYVWRTPKKSQRKANDSDVYQWMSTIITLDARKRLLNELIDIQNETNFKLISQEEIDLIHEKWKEFPDGDKKGREWKYYDGLIQQGVDDYF